MLHTSLVSLAALLGLLLLLVYHTFTSHTRKDIITGVAALMLLLGFLCLAG